MKKVFVLAVAILSLGACSQPKEKTPADLSKAELISSVEALHDSLVNPTSLELSEKHANKLMSYCLAFAEKFPQDTAAAEMLYKASRSARGLQQFQQSIDIYNQIIKDYPNYIKLPECYFFKAFVYDNDIKDKPKAEVAYKEVIAKFPDHRFATDAALLIEHLYLSDEELIKLFEEKNKPADKPV
jgi:tetratricopeptide (TPR) repeat protein